MKAVVNQQNNNYSKIIYMYSRERIKNTERKERDFDRKRVRKCLPEFDFLM